jgi:hypothetical protein
VAGAQLRLQLPHRENHILIPASREGLARKAHSGSAEHQTFAQRVLGHTETLVFCEEWLRRLEGDRVPVETVAAQA